MADEVVPFIEPGDDSPYALLRMDANEARELLADALGGEALAFKDLDRIKVPSGGATIWEVPTLDGEVGMKELKGVIIHRGSRRAYWPYPMEERPDDDDGRPVCASVDGLIGVGEPGGSCAECPYNEFNTDIKGGPGKACKETRQLFILTESDILPLVLNIPPGSLANAKAYFLRLLRNQLKPEAVVTVIKLEKAESAGKVKFGRVTFAKGENLSPEAQQRLRDYAAVMAPAMEAAAMVKRDEVDD